MNTMTINGIKLRTPPFDIPPEPAAMTRAAPALSHAEKVEALRAARRAMRLAPHIRSMQEDYA